MTTRDLRYDRSRFVLPWLRRLGVERTAKKLESAPMEVRSLGLPLAVTGWDRDQFKDITQLVADWLYAHWGLLPDREAPQDAVGLLRALEEDSDGATHLYSAAETEAIEIVQTAKILVGARGE